MICNKESFKNLKRSDLIELECDLCKVVFYRTKKICYQNIYRKGIINLDSKCFCSKECRKIFAENTFKEKRSTYVCSHCNASFDSLKILSPKFCSQSCSATHNNQARGLKTRRKAECVSCKSFLEVPNWIKRQNYRCSTCVKVSKHNTNNKKLAPVKIKNCKECKNSFVESAYILYCSKECKQLSTRPHRLTCKYCNSCYRANKSNSKFCSRSCRSKCLSLHTFAHKKSGLSRSKIELHIEKKLLEDFPDLEIRFNDKEIIGSEIDIYFPSLKLGFELNGIFHYIPVYGQDILNKTQSRDKQKLEECARLNIKLVVIDLGNCGFTKAHARKIYDMILLSIEQYK